MKKLLILMLVLGMASLANAGLIELSVDGSPAPSEITLVESDFITLDVTVGDGYFAGGDLLISLSNAQGALDDSGITFITPVMTHVYYGSPYFTWLDSELAWEVPWGVAASSSTSVYMSGGNLYWNTVGPYTLMNDLLFHCEEDTDVIIDLSAASDIVYYVQDEVGNTTEIVTLYEEGTIIDSIYVTQIPEPMTIVLLGLGSLFLLKRRK